MRFTRVRRGGVAARLEPVEAGLLRHCALELLTLLGPSPEQDADPLAALVGLPDGPVRRPDDPALARLLPDAYADAEDAGEFRRYTEGELAEGKRRDARAAAELLAPLVDAGGRLVLDREQADSWLRWLTDIRLVLGSRLQVTEEMTEPPPDDPRAPVWEVYGWLGWVQESLLSCLEPRSLP